MELGALALLQGMTAAALLLLAISIPEFLELEGVNSPDFIGIFAPLDDRSAIVFAPVERKLWRLDASGQTEIVEFRDANIVDLASRGRTWAVLTDRRIAVSSALTAPFDVDLRDRDSFRYLTVRLGPDLELFAARQHRNTHGWQVVHLDRDGVAHVMHEDRSRKYGATSPGNPLAHWPLRFTIDEEGNLFVADRVRYLIVKYNRFGSEIARIERPVVAEPLISSDLEMDVVSTVLPPEFLSELDPELRAPPTIIALDAVDSELMVSTSFRNAENLTRVDRWEAGTVEARFLPQMLLAPVVRTNGRAAWLADVGIGRRPPDSRLDASQKPTRIVPLDRP